MTKPKREHKIIVVTDKGTAEHTVLKDEIVIGRESDVDVQVQASWISRRHMRITFKRGEVTLEDLASKHGTHIDNEPVKPNTPTRLLPDRTIVVCNGAVKITVIPSWDRTDLSVASIPATPAPAIELESPNGGTGAKAGARPNADPGTHQDDSVSLALRSDQLTGREKNKLEAMRKQKTALENEIAERQNIATSLDKAIASKRSGISKLEENAVALQKKYEALEQQHEKAQAELSRTHEETEKVWQEKKRLEQTCRNLEANLAQAEEKAAAESERITQLHESDKEAESNRRAASEELDTLRADRSRIKTEIARVREERNRLRNDVQRFREEEKGLQTRRSRAQEISNDLHLERRRVEVKLSESKSELEYIQVQMKSDLARMGQLHKDQQAIELASRTASDQFEKMRSQSSLLQADIERMQREHAELLQLATRNRTEFEIEHQKREDAEISDRRKRAEFEAYESERKAARMKLEVEFETVHVKKAILDKDIQLAMLKKDDVERECEQLRQAMARDMERYSENESKSKDQIHQALIQLKSVEEQTRQQHAIQENLASDIQKLKQTIEESRTEHPEALRKIETARQEHQWVQGQIATVKAQAEKEIETRKAAFEAQITEWNSKRESDFDEYRREQKKKIDAEYLEKFKHMEASLAQKRLDEERKLEQLRAQEERLMQDRRSETARSVAQAVSHLVSTQVGSAEALRKLEKNVHEVALRALNHESAPVDGTGFPMATPETGRKARRFWARMGKVSISAAAIIVVLMIFPKLPHQIASKAYRAIASHSSTEDNVFLEEIRKKGEKFHPAVTREYHDTYVENVLYTEDYVAMKTDEEIKRRWTLALNDFFIGNLGVGDRVIVDFVAAESVLVKQLEEQAKNIEIEFKDIGIGKLKDDEAQSLPRLQELIGGKENYVKFRKYEKAFYEDYLAKSPSHGGG